MSLFSEIRRRNVHRMAILYVAVAWLLMQVAQNLIDLADLPPRFGQFVLIALAVGFPIALVISWFYEMTPEGLTLEKNVESAETDAYLSGRRVDFIIIAVLAAALTLYVFLRPPIPDDSTSLPPNSIAVLPFTNMTDDPGGDYFSDGLTETILHMLTQINEIKVVARTSSFAFKNQNKDIRDIAATLGVAHVLEGGVQRSGDRLRITVQLVRAADGFHVWSESYDRRSRDIFEIQDEIAIKVGRSLASTILADEAAILFRSISTRDVDSYDLYMRARSEAQEFSFSGFRSAESLLKAALSKDPDFLDAKAALAQNLWEQSLNRMRPFEEVIGDIAALSEQVLAVDAAHPLARMMQLSAEYGQLDPTGDYSEWPGIKRRMQAVVDETPGNSEIKMQFAHHLINLNQSREALSLLQSALVNDPLNARIHFRLSDSYMDVGEWDNARASAVRSIELQPDSPNAYYVLAQIEAHAGDGVAMLENYLRAMSADPEDYGYAAVVAERLYLIGLPEYGDLFRSRVAAIDPLSADLVGLDLTRAMTTGDTQASINFARRIIDYPVSEAGEYWVRGVHILLQNAVAQGSIDETIAFLDEKISGFSDLGNLAVMARTQIVRLESISALRAIKHEDELSDYIERATSYYSALKFDLEELPRVHISVLVFRGETDAAIDFALSRLLSRPVVLTPDWRYLFGRPDYAELATDPRVRQELRRLEEEEARYRADVRTLMVEHGY